MTDNIIQTPYNKSRKDKFIFVLTLPEAMKDISYTQQENRDDENVLPDTLQFSVYGANIPSVKVDSGDIRFSGQTVKFSTHSRPAYDNVTINFTIDNRFNNYWVIWKWLDILNDDTDAIFMKNADITTSTSMFKQYQGTATMYALDEYNVETMKFDFLGVVPVSIGSIDYNYRDEDEIETSFEFSFSKLVPTLL